WVEGCRTCRRVLFSVMVPDVAAGHAGWPTTPHRNIVTPPFTLVGAKCRWATAGAADSPEKVNEKVMVLPTSMWNVAAPAVLIGATSFSPLRLTETSSVAE